MSLVVGGSRVELAHEGQDVEIVLDRTPFYPEGGGQVGDRGTITTDEGRAMVADTQTAAPGVIAKHGVLPESIPDWLALVGDTADGIPGLPGWGKSSAAKVLSAWRHVDAIPADPVGQEVVRLDLVIRARAQAVVPRAVEGIVLVAEPRRVRQVEPVRILILLPLVLVEGASQLERLERRGLDGDLANAGPGLAGVRGQHAVLEETRLRRIGHVGGEDAGPPVLDVLALPGEVEVDLLHAGRERASQRCVEVLVPAASTLEFAEDSLRRSEVLVASVLGDDIDGARLHAPVFRVESARLDHDLLDRVVVDRRRGDAGQRILLRKSVDVVGDLVRSSAADDQRVVVLSFIVDVQLEVHDAGLLGDRVLVSAQGLVLEILAGEELRGAGHVLLDERPLPPDDHFRHVRQHGRLHVEIELRAEVGDDLDVLPHHRHIPQERDPYGVLAGRHVQDDVVPLSVRHRAAFQVGNRDTRNRDGLSRLGVVHDARELPRGARPGRSGKENGARHDDGCA